MAQKSGTTSLERRLAETLQHQSRFDLVYSKFKLGSLIESPSFQKSFTELTTISERIKFVLSHEAVTRLIANLVVRGNLQDDDKKSGTKAAQFGQDGNCAFQARRYEDALASYSSAIRYAPQDGGLLPIAFGSRSGAFFMLKQFEAALKDIEAAQSHAQYKPFFMLTIRKCQCLLRLGRVAQAKKILDAIKRDDLNNSDSVLLDKFHQRERENLKVVEEEDEESKDIEPELLKNVSSVIKILSEKGRFEPHSVNSSLSSKVEVRYDEKNGRHLVTTEDVHFGDILAVTKPYAAVLTENTKELLLCHHCFASLKPIPDIFPRTVPCSDCSRVLYCSEHCRTESWQEYHRFECSLLWISFGKSILSNTGSCHSNYHLALRTLIVAGGLESIREVTEKFPAASDPSKSADFTHNPKDYYENVYRMEMKKYDSIKEHAMKIISVACLFEWSKLAEINDEDMSKTASPNVAAASEKDIFVMETLLRHYLQIIKRQTPFLRSDQTALDNPSAFVEYVTPLDPLICLVQESCDPNTSIFVVDCVRAAPHVSNVCVFFAVKPIPAGTVLSAVCRIHGDSVMYRLYLEEFVQTQYIWNQNKLLHPCEYCEGKRSESPFGSITSLDGYELVCCGANCDGFIRRTDGDQVNCCTCKRDIGPIELAELKKIYSDISKFYSQAKVLLGRVKTLVENDKEVLPNLPEDFGTILLQLETLINDCIAPLALKHSRLMLVDLYKQLGTYYWYFHRRNSNMFDYLLKGWKYAEVSHTTLEAHFGGGDSLKLLKLLQENVDRFFKMYMLGRLQLDYPNRQFSFFNLDDNGGESRNKLVRFVERHDAAQGRLRNMNQYYKMI